MGQTRSFYSNGRFNAEIILRRNEFCTENEAVNTSLIQIGMS